MPKRSWVWQYYSTPEDSYVACNVCSKKLKYDKCTTNLIKHVKLHDISKPTEECSTVGESCSYILDFIRLYNSLITL